MEEEIYALGKARNGKHVLGPALLNLRHRLSELLVAFGRRVALAVFVERALHPISYHLERLRSRTEAGLRY